jgi:hypothetical protein
VQALYDYAATIDEEFSFQAGDIIAVFQTDPDGWWQGELLDEDRKQIGGNTFPSCVARSPGGRPCGLTIRGQQLYAAPHVVDAPLRASIRGPPTDTFSCFSLGTAVGVQRDVFHVR